MAEDEIDIAKCYTTKEIAWQLGVKMDLVTRWCYKSYINPPLKSVKIGRKRYIKPEWLDEFLDRKMDEEYNREKVPGFKPLSRLDDTGVANLVRALLKQTLSDYKRQLKRNAEEQISTESFLRSDWFYALTWGQVDGDRLIMEYRDKYGEKL